MRGAGHVPEVVTGLLGRGGADAAGLPRCRNPIVRLPWDEDVPLSML